MLRWHSPDVRRLVLVLAALNVASWLQFPWHRSGHVISLVRSQVPKGQHTALAAEPWWRSARQGAGVPLRQPSRHREQITQDGSLEGALARLAKSHLPVTPSPDIFNKLILLNANPVILLIPDLWPRESCEHLIFAAKASGAMRQSSCTGYGLLNGEAKLHRTSGSVVMKPETARRYEAEHLVRKLHRDFVGVLGVGAGTQPDLMHAEYPQVVRYERGQRFSDHEDAFCWEQAKADNYQRCATLLVYLNDVGRGGTTCFPQLALEVQPKQGHALVFFPSFADGRPDMRTLHSAEPAVDEKWIAQVWLGRRIDTSGPQSDTY